MSLTGFVFLLAFATGLGLSLIRNPVYGLYTYIAVFYLDPPSRWWGAFLPDLRWSLFASVVTLLAIIKSQGDKTRPSWLSHTPAWFLLLYSAWLWIQMAWALNPDVHREACVLFTKYIVLFYIVYRLVDTPEAIRRFALVHILGCFYLGWIAYGTAVSGRLDGVGGPGIDEANALAMQLSTGVAMGAMIILSEGGWIRWACVVAMAFMLNTIVLAGSRGAFIGMVAAGLVVLYMRPIAFRRLFYAFAVLGVLLFLSLAPKTFWERMGTIAAAVDDRAELDTSAESRLALISAQWKMAQRFPLGAGHRGTEILSPQYLDEKYLANIPGQAQRTRSSHNTFMTALVEQGIPGALLYVALWLWVARTVRRLKLHARLHWSPGAGAQLAGVGGALALVFVTSMFVDYLKIEVQVWLFALLASFSALARREEAPAAKPLELHEGPAQGVSATAQRRYGVGGAP